MKTLRSIRLLSGLVLFCFVVMHFCNHAFGLVSIDAMEQASEVLMLPWSNPIGSMIIIISILTHALLGLYALYRRPSLRLTAFDSFQLLLGLAIPVFLMPHLVVMLLKPMLHGESLDYADVLDLYWIYDPWLGLSMVLGVVAVWIHGCMGLFVWLRVQPWWLSVRSLVYPTIVLLPILALLGFAESGKEIAAINDAGSANTTAEVAPTAVDEAVDEESVVPKEERVSLKAIIDNVYRMALALLVLTLLARWWRVRSSDSPVLVVDADGNRMYATAGTTLLEISRQNDVPHGSLCGGKGRCGTCQVVVESGADNLSVRTDIEQKLLTRIDADANVRLACQAVALDGEIAIHRLLSRPATPADARQVAEGKLTADTQATFPIGVPG